MRRTRTIIAAGTTALTVVAGPVAVGRCRPAARRRRRRRRQRPRRPRSPRGPPGTATRTSRSRATAGTTRGTTTCGWPTTRRAGVLSGSAVMRARATQNLSRFDLDLAGLTVSAVTVDGTPARVPPYGAGAGRHARPRDPFGVQVLRRRPLRRRARRRSPTPTGRREGWVRTPRRRVRRRRAGGLACPGSRPTTHPRTRRRTTCG